MNLEGTDEFNRNFRAVVGGLEELQGENIEPEWSRELDEYAERLMGVVGSALTPYRWASYLEDAVVQYCQTSDYTVGDFERADVAQGIVNARLLDVDDEFERQQLYEAFQIWAVTNRRKL